MRTALLAVMFFAACGHAETGTVHFKPIGDQSDIPDRYRLTEAVMNLAHNAVQYTYADDVIAIGSDLAGGEWRLWVRDTGTGIAAADQERIFERFARGSTSGREHRGSGLGLALVEAIAEGHGGRVDLVSRLGEGSTFTIVLPVRPHVEVEPWPAS